MDWSEVEAVIAAVMSMPERADSVKELLIELGRQCPGIKATVVPQYHPDQKHDWREAFVAISSGLRTLTRDWVLYFEDDVQVAPYMGEDLLPVLSEAKPDVGIISMFSEKRSDIALFNDGVRLHEFPRGDVEFAYSQAVAIRREVAEYWGAHMVSWWDSAKESLKRAPDVCLGAFCRELNKRVFILIPNLAQHRRGPSAFSNTYHPHSHTFGLRRSQ
jgi:hypothetical protein